MSARRRWWATINDMPLRYKIIIPVVLVEACVFLAAMRATLTSVRSVATRGLHAEASARLRLLSAAYLQMTLTGEQEYFRDLVAVVSRAPDVVSVTMRPLAGPTPENTVEQQEDGSHVYTSWQRVQVFEHATDIGISYTDRAAVEAVADARMRYVWLLGIGVLLTTLVLWACILAITEPVGRVADAANHLAAGEHPPRFLMSRRDEVGMLAYAFDTMAERLHDAQRQLEEIISDRTRQLEAMFHNLPVGVLRIGPDRVVQAVNPAMARMIGAAPEDIVGRQCFALMSTDGRVCPECVLGASTRSISRHTCSLRIGTRSERILESTVVRIPGPNGNGSLVMELAQDVTEERRLQAQLLQSSKLASIGQLASGLAHEVNNPLATIRLRCDSLMADLEELRLPESMREDVAAIQRQASRVSLITQELLTFSRCTTGERQPVDLRDVIASALILSGLRARRHHVALTREEASDLPPVSANGTQLEQVVVNLLNNAIDASPPERTVVTAARAQDGMVELRVQDRGSGIAPEDLERIFDPFYTTKEVGEGTGLGLSISYGIVTAHGGTIDVSSKLGEGTTVTVRLPALAAERSARA